MIGFNDNESITRHVVSEPARREFERNDGLAEGAVVSLNQQKPIGSC